MGMIVLGWVSEKQTGILLVDANMASSTFEVPPLNSTSHACWQTPDVVA
jgi:hypothetical protein